MYYLGGKSHVYDEFKNKKENKSRRCLIMFLVSQIIAPRTIKINGWSFFISRWLLNNWKYVLRNASLPSLAK